MINNKNVSKYCFNFCSRFINSHLLDRVDQNISEVTKLVKISERSYFSASEYLSLVIDSDNDEDFTRF